MLVHDCPVITAGGGLGHLNLALYLIVRQSPALAQLIRQYLAVDSDPSQALFIVHERMHHDDPLLLALEAHLRAHLSEPFHLSQVAPDLGVSTRTQQRWVNQVMGRSPIQLLQDLRLAQTIRRMRLGAECLGGSKL